MIDSHRSPGKLADWKAAIPQLQCLRCGFVELRVADGHDEPRMGLICQHCDWALHVEDELFIIQEQHSGNNQIAAEFYDSPRWRQYRFWKFFTPFNDRAVRRWSEEVFKFLPDLSETRILDIAIGDGRNMPFFPPDCDVYGVDISAAQLRDCQNRFPDRRLWLFQGEAEALPFRDNSFDHVLSFGAFNYFNDPLGSLREMTRVVKPGGLVVVTDEYADLPDRMFGKKIGWPGLDRWFMSSFLHLGSDFTAMIERHRDLKIEPIVDQVLSDWRIHQVCKGWAYCFVGRAKKE